MLSFIILQAQASQGGFYSQILMIVLIVVVFYFFMIRPQQKKQKETKTFQQGLKAGDRVVTLSGVHGKIIKVDTEGATIKLEIDQGVVITLERNAVSFDSSKKLN